MSPFAGGGVVPIAAVIVFDFDPVGVILGTAVRWQYVAVAAVIFATLLLAGALAVIAERRRAERLLQDPERTAAVAEAAQAAEETVRASAQTPAEAIAASAAAGTALVGSGSPLPSAAPDASADATPPTAPVSAPVSDERPWPVGLRGDDLLFIVAGGIAGAVVAGRLGWALLYLDWYRGAPGSILDTTVGGLTLAAGVAGGVVAGMLMARVLGAPVGRWLGIAVVPLLLALGLGKLAMVLGGAGQGLPSDADWATAFAGAGPWGSLAPMIPSHPSQVYEAATTGGALVVVLALSLVPAFRRHPAALFAVGIGLWAAGRFAVAFTWRDPALVGGLNGDQLVTAGIAVVAAASLLALAIRARRRRRAPAAEAQPPRSAEAPPPRSAAASPSAATSGTGGGEPVAER